MHEKFYILFSNAHFIESVMNSFKLNIPKRIYSIWVSH
jgi:hypothetical protein